MDIVSIVVGAVAGVPAWTVVKWLGQRYVLEPRIMPFLDRKLKPYTKSNVQSDLDLLIKYMSIDWVDHHSLPAQQVYMPLYNQLKPHIGKYINSREYTIFNVACEFYISISDIEKPTNSELVELHHYLKITLVPILERVKTQLGPG